ncbi:YjjG family noncanonical pyrimidine nucleotidase [Vagococcus sp. BWB3-3]|uniref:YjjG family noncanonical pyrimidine nucleotidase n=1 Tax=Vagococcus allomyrinae TaxID=2794353 RepID=A0A940PI57_9ENTE|nr:YjjG family noncanonical pyrimidine nucleotidase [Vagococcus allomyrinae]MBP1044373.1 YjjG family noncanonical pyrimidine nucleotidase [Vagococcus allomyrinae]
MTKYESLLFDVDETLLNFKEGQYNAVTQLFISQGVTLTPEIRQRYEVKNAALWHAFEKGELAKEQVLADRFTYIFNECGVKRDGREMDQIFRGYLKEEAILLDGAFDIIAELSRTHQLYVVTNGVSATQYRRLEKSKLAPYFNEIFVSEDTGYQKPMPEFFQHAFERMTSFNPAKTLIIGDSLIADIQGGNQAGIDSCWYNPQGVANQQAILPTYEIQQLSQLREIV